MLGLALLALVPAALAQTYTSCNPLSQSCPADPALSQSLSVDFTSGPSSFFSPSGAPAYDATGAKFTVAKSKDAPQINANFYIMFGHVDVVMRAAPGGGVVSSIVLESDCLDEIDWEWVGSDPTTAQTNYFGKGLTGNFDRGKTVGVPGGNAFAAYHTYSIDWTSAAVTWSIDGTVVRRLAYGDAKPGEFPQTPMKLKIGSWSGGDPANPEGTIKWAGGPTNYAAGPYSMLVKSLLVTDYSTGKEYTYSDNSGTWQSIRSNGGKINPVAGSVGTGNQSSSSSAVSSTITASPTSASSVPSQTLATNTRVRVQEAVTQATAVATPTSSSGASALVQSGSLLGAGLLAIAALV